VDEFLRGKTNVVRMNRSETVYRKDDLPEKLEIHVFSL